MIAEVLYSLITESEPTKTLLGDRMWPNELPKTTSFDVNSKDLPACFYQKASETRQDEVDLVQTMWNLTITCNNSTERDTVTNAVKQVLHRYKGGPIWYIGFSGQTDMFDEKLRKPYSVMTFIVTSYGMEV